MVAPVPSNMRGFVPYVFAKNAEEAVQFYVKAFGGKRGVTLRMKDERIAHAEIFIGDACIMISEENPEWGAKGAKTLGGCPMTLTLYLQDVDAAAKQAEAAGMTVKRKLETHFFGDRMCTLQDPYGYEWCLATHVEDVAEDVMQKRMEELYG